MTSASQWAGIAKERAMRICRDSGCDRVPCMPHMELTTMQTVRDAVAEEREACANVAETCWVEGSFWRIDIANAIRARGAK